MADPKPTPTPTPPPPRQKGDNVDPHHPERQELAEAGVDHRLATKEEQAEAKAEAEANYHPTPTQRENDLLKTGGMHIDDKEDDGSESDVAASQRAAIEKLDNPYVAKDKLREDREKPAQPKAPPKK